jgi:SAM-dependent methyltransferase
MELRQSIEQRLRAALDRALMPYVHRTADLTRTQLLVDGSVPLDDRHVAGAVVLRDFNHLLHELRTIELSRMPRIPADGTLLSAGCAGLWYFEWIEAAYGKVGRHIGVEAYAPRPEALPHDVGWIANTVGDMRDVPTSSVDLVFSGQNVEHLWPEEVAGFLLEAWRVLRPGGRLVLDSPNEPIAAALGWTHPQHTVELPYDEARALVELAGFDVTSCRGVWRCPAGRPLDAALDVPSILDRAVRAADDPAESFVWWIEANKRDETPDAGSVQRAARRAFAAHWPARVHRAARRVDGTLPDLVPVGYTTNGFPLAPGEWIARAEARSAGGRPTDAASVRLELEGDSASMVATRRIDPGRESGDGTSVTVAFDVPATVFDVRLAVRRDDGARGPAAVTRPTLERR